MIRKSLIVVGVMFLTQFLFSCFPCDCPQPQSFELRYNAVSATAYDTSGFQDKEVKGDTIYRNAFGLGVSFNFDLIELSDAEIFKPSYGFGYAMAFSCDCIGDEHTIPDPIDYLEIYVTDIATSETREVTNLFATYQYNEDGLIPLDEFFDQREEGHDGFQFTLVEFDAIPASAIFSVDAYLKSGKKFTATTDQINFY